MGIRNAINTRGSVLAAAWLALASPARAQGPELSMPVVVYDYAGVAPVTLDRAQRVVSTVFGDIGVAVVWMDTAEFTRRMPPSDLAERRAFVSSVLQINVVPPAMYQALGFRTHSAGSAESGTRIAWVSLAKVQRSADLATADLGDVLGYVIAHEIGHLLLPANSHSLGGVMQENVDAKLIAHNRLSFLEQEATLIRRALADRIARARAAASR